MIDELRCIACDLPLEKGNLCPKCERQQGLMFGEKWDQTNSNQSDILYYDGLYECPCPICSGNPAEDFIFKELFEDKEEFYDTWYD